MSDTFTVSELARQVSESNPASVRERGYDIYGQANRAIGIYQDGAFREAVHLGPLQSVDFERLGIAFPRFGAPVTVTDEEWVYLLDESRWPTSSPRFADHLAERLYWYWQSGMGVADDARRLGVVFRVLFLGRSSEILTVTPVRVSVQTYDSKSDAEQAWSFIPGEPC